VGQIVDVRPHIINSLLAQGIMPVISPISLGVDGQIYNVNADEAAAALAAALSAKMVNFISDVPAVLDQDKRPIPILTPSLTEQLITNGVIYDGMVPKVRAALGVIGQGVPYARIVNLGGLANGSGTIFGLNGDGNTR
jgi:acetylglutamate kinase